MRKPGSKEHHDAHFRQYRKYSIIQAQKTISAEQKFREPPYHVKRMREEKERDHE